MRAPDLSSPRTRSMLAIVAGSAAALAVPAMMGAAQVQGLASTIVLAMSLLSLNVLLGYTGQISLGHAAFVGAGGFAAINVAGRLSLESAGPAGRIVELLLAAVVAGMAIGLLTTLIGLPALRIKGLQVAIATLAFGAAAQTYLFTQPWFTGGGSGLSVDPLFGRGEVYRFYVVAVLTLGLLVVVDRRLLGTQLGRAFVAVRDGEDRAAAFGVDAGVSKLRAYAVSGVFAGIAGAFSVHISGSVEGIDLIVINSLVLLSYVVLGGIGSRAGILAVAFLLIAPQTVGLFDAVPIVNSIFTPKFIQLISGLLLIVIVIFLPTGYGGLLDDQKRLWRRLPVAARAGVVSVVAVVVGMQLVREQGFRSAEIFDGTRAPAFALVFALLALAAALAGYLALLFSDTGDAAVAEVGGALAVGGEAGDRARQAAGAARELRNVPRAVSLRMPTRVLLESRNVTMRFGSVTAIDDLTLEVREGEIVGLIGANGAGKSTFFNCVSGFITPQEGSIRYRGQELITAKPSSRTKLGIGRTFQHMGLMRPETVGDNVLLAQHWLADYDGFAGMLGLAGSIQTERQLRQRAQAALRIFGLEHLRDVRLGSLPYGTMRMVELASTVASGADLLFFDEASAGLGPDEAHALGDRFHALRDELGLSLVVIEHHVPLIARTCDHVYCLASGRMLAHGRPSEVQSNTEVIAEFLGRSQIGEDGEAVIGKIGHDDAGAEDTGMAAFTPDLTPDLTSQVRT